MILVKVSKSSLRRASFNDEKNATIHSAKLNLIEEERELTRIREEAIKQRIAQKIS